MKKVYFIFCFMLVLRFNISAQTDSTKPTNPTKEKVSLDEQIKSGNYKDAFLNLAQVAYKDFTDGKHFQINSSLISIRSLIDTLSLIDTNYNKHFFARRSNILFDLNLKDNNNFSIKDATLGFKFAIINHRDKTFFNSATQFPSSKVYYKEKNQIDLDAFSWVNSMGDTFDTDQRTKIGNYLFQKSNVKFADLPQKFQDYFIQVLKSSDLFKNTQPDNYGNVLQAMKDSLLEIVGKRWLLTSTVSYKFDPVIHAEIEALRAFGNQHAPLSFEFDGKTMFDMIDSVKVDGSYNRQTSETSVGLNLVYRKAARSMVELKLAGSYKYIISGAQAKENNSLITVDGTLRIRLTEEIWIPLTFKYNPKNGKVLGFLNMTVNF